MSILRKFRPYFTRAWLRELFAARSERGPYRFLVSRFERVNSPDLAARILETDLFRTQLTPVRPPVETAGPYLVIAPHQDDEAIGAGGTLLLAARAGAEIHVLFATDGAQPLGGQTPASMVEMRSKEADEVCRRLGATRHDLGIANLDPRPGPGQIRALRDLIGEVRPAVILTPWLLDLPPKHRMANHLLYLAHRIEPLPECEVWGYQVHNGLIPNACVDITEVAEEKRDLIRLYRSQLELAQAYDHLGLGLAAWNSRFLPTGPEARYAEVFTTLPAAEFTRLASRMYDGNLTDVYGKEPGIAAVMGKLRREIG